MIRECLVTQNTLAPKKKSWSALSTSAPLPSSSFSARAWIKCYQTLFQDHERSSFNSSTTFLNCLYFIHLIVGDWEWVWRKWINGATFREILQVPIWSVCIALHQCQCHHQHLQNCQNRKHHQNHQHLQNIRIVNIIKVFNIFKIIKIFKIIRIINIFFLPIAWIELRPKFQSIFAVVKTPTEAEKRHYLIIYIYLICIYNIFW